MPETAWKVRRAGRVAGVMLVVFWVALSFGLTFAGFAGGVIAIVWAATGLVVVGVWRSAFVPYIALTERGVVVQNPLLRSNVPYADIASVDPGYYGITIRRRRGDAVTAW